MALWLKATINEPMTSANSKLNAPGLKTMPRVKQYTIKYASHKRRPEKIKLTYRALKIQLPSGQFSGWLKDT